MKKILFIYFALLTLRSFSQYEPNKIKKDEDYNLFISGGIHTGFWAMILEQQISSRKLPYNIQIDKLFKDKYVLGLGYSYDTYGQSPASGHISAESVRRQNIRVRFYKFLTDPQRIFSMYIGTAVGISYWNLGNMSGQGYNQYWPTAQFLFGVKVKLSETFFWQTEMGAGPPCFLQTSLGIKF